ncbi:hypothetical protein [Pelomonas cellulosilytica]|uniref:Uncharacterized protein n=1 Tax=Pelomonas cellulosilytica TaxID=2906762 RepID=A0ABS8Y0R6_9BURK|nr:hypothetical protein [Pelomonas sp. P8]MCE4557873.1 hypothetical protein [Pelomonas sp. P8]
MSERNNYIDNMKLELDTLNDQLGSLEARVMHVRQEARQQYEGELARLRTQSREALAKWESLQGSTEATWHQAVPDMDRLRNAFFHAFHLLKARM